MEKMTKPVVSSDGYSLFRELFPKEGGKGTTGWQLNKNFDFYKSA